MEYASRSKNRRVCPKHHLARMPQSAGPRPLDLETMNVYSRYIGRSAKTLEKWAVIFHKNDFPKFHCKLWTKFKFFLDSRSFVGIYFKSVANWSKWKIGSGWRRCPGFKMLCTITVAPTPIP
ncbi:hypothetical protein TNCT_166621 [Trichonephila clavata]|uniref:Uncharacterized protein n=1 Tax=Trichonephila clavata TaxID=2740835 RepID=A0A8X6L7T1_TRICU|nr:hypothetical protein TNCT_166621 [Trichonephila clavata]